MGTRHLTVVVSDGKMKVAQYGQWDGYPAGTGMSLLGFLISADLDRLRKNLKRCRFESAKTIRAMCEKVLGRTIKDGWVNLDESKKLEEAYPLLHRNTGAGALELIINNNEDGPIILQNAFDFGYDSLFCEWAYVVDLDAETFTVYQGFQKDTPTEGLWTKEVKEKGKRAEYQGIKPIKTCSFSRSPLPDRARFLAECDPDDEEE